MDTIHRALLLLGAVDKEGKAPAGVMEDELAVRMQDCEFVWRPTIYAMVGLKLGVRDAVS